MPSIPVNTRKVQDQRAAARQLLLHAVSVIPEGQTLPLLEDIRYQMGGVCYASYHAADRAYVYGVDEFGNDIQHSIVGNEFGCPLLHKLTAAVTTSLKEFTA